MTALKDRFWAKVVFKEFIRHYRKMTAEQKAADIDASMDALEDLDDTGNSFGSKMVRWSMERVDQYPMAQENGKKGGRPRKETTADGDIREGAEVSLHRESVVIEPTTISKNIGNDQGTEALEQPRTGGDSVRRVGVASPAVCHKSAGAPVRNSGRKFRNKEEFIQWAIDTGLDPVDASECWDATEERGGRDADGNPVKNMKAFAAQWCRTRKTNRRTA